MLREGGREGGRGAIHREWSEGGTLAGGTVSRRANEEEEKKEKEEMEEGMAEQWEKSSAQGTSRTSGWVSEWVDGRIIARVGGWVAGWLAGWQQSKAKQSNEKVEVEEEPMAFTGNCFRLQHQLALPRSLGRRWRRYRRCRPKSLLIDRQLRTSH